MLDGSRMLWCYMNVRKGTKYILKGRKQVKVDQFHRTTEVKQNIIYAAVRICTFGILWQKNMNNAPGAYTLLICPTCTQQGKTLGNVYISKYTACLSFILHIYFRINASETTNKIKKKNNVSTSQMLKISISQPWRMAL